MTELSPLPSAIDVADLIRRGEVSARAVVTSCLARLAATQEALNAFVHIDADGALATADRVDAAIRCRIDLDQVECPALADRDA